MGLGAAEGDEVPGEDLTFRIEGERTGVHVYVYKHATCTCMRVYHIYIYIYRERESGYEDKIAVS